MSRPPKWQRFDLWVVLGALVGLGIAFAAFCLVHFLLYGNFAFIKHMQSLAGATEVKPGDIFTMTATALGGFTIGGAAIMQFRKHKWGEYQAKMDEDTRTGERLSKAIEHLGNGQSHIQLGAIYEFKNLAEDSARNKENIVQLLTAYIKNYKLEEGKDLPQNVDAAARVLSPMVRELIEFKANSFGPIFAASPIAWYGFRFPKSFRPAQCVFEA